MSTISKSKAVKKQDKKAECHQAAQIGLEFMEVYDLMGEIEEQVASLTDMLTALNRRVTSLEAQRTTGEHPYVTPPYIITCQAGSHTTADMGRWYWDAANQTWGKV